MAKRGRKRKSGARTKSGRLSEAYQGPARDNGTPELQAKRLAIVGAGADPTLSTTMPGVLFAHGILDQDQYDQAQRYRQLRCALYGPPWPANAPVGTGSLDDETVKKIQAKFDAIVTRFDPEQKHVVASVCVYDEPPIPDAIDTLKTALAEMA